MKIVVVYQSKSGYSRQYAEWIAEELAADLFERPNASVEMLYGYDAVVYGGGLYESGINGVDLITGNLDRLEGRRIAVYATGASPARADVLQDVVGHNFTPEQQKAIRFFYLRGGFDYSRLTARDKMLMKLLKWKIKCKKRLRLPLVPDEMGMLAAYDKPADFVKRKNIGDLVEYVKALSQEPTFRQ